MRTIILFLLGAVAMACIFSEPDAQSPTWWTDLLRSKLIGLAALLAFWAINRYWHLIISKITKL